MFAMIYSFRKADQFFNMTTGERIKNARINAGLDQKQLADALGVKVPFISQYEHDRRNPKIETLKRIADAIGCSVYDLIDSEASSSENYEQIHMFNMQVEELKIQLNYLKSAGMTEEAALKEKELKTLIGDTDWVAGPATEQQKEPAPEESRLTDDVMELVDNYDALNQEGKDILLNTSRGLVASGLYQEEPTTSAG